MPPRENEEDSFLDAITAINLRRIWIIALVGTAIALAVFLSELLLVRSAEVARVAGIDVFTSCAAVLLFWLVRRRPRTGRWPRLVAMGFALAWLLSLDAYYFEAFAAGTHNASYAIGVMCAAVFFLLPPAVFLPALAINHVYYCATLLMWAGRSPRQVLPPLVDGTVCVAVAGLASWLLYQAARENFFKTRALAASNAGLREVMAIAAHDLRSPLLDLRNLLGLARRESSVAEGPLARMLDLATDSCGAMVNLVSRLIEAHAAEESGTKLQLGPHDLRAACTAAAERWRAAAETKNQRIALELPDGSALVRADAGSLAQVLENLLGNALKFSPSDSTISCVVATRDRLWRIEVHDEGPGVPEDERGQLFRKFHRGSARPTGNEASTGLGLHIVKTLTEAMGGTVSHAPRAPRGSIFRVELPAHGAPLPL